MFIPNGLINFCNVLIKESFNSSHFLSKNINNKKYSLISLNLSILYKSFYLSFLLILISFFFSILIF